MALIRTSGNGSLGALNITYFNNKNASNEAPLTYTCLSDSDVIFSFGCANSGNIRKHIRAFQVFRPAHF